MTMSNQPVSHGFIEVETFALYIGTVRPADMRALVGIQTHPVQRLDDLFHRAGDKALAIGILDPEKKYSAALTSKSIVDGGLQSCAYVGLARGTGRNSGNHGISRESARRIASLPLVESLIDKQMCWLIATHDDL